MAVVTLIYLGRPPKTTSCISVFFHNYISTSQKLAVSTLRRLIRDSIIEELDVQTPYKEIFPCKGKKVRPLNFNVISRFLGAYEVLLCTIPPQPLLVRVFVLKRKIKMLSLALQQQFHLYLMGKCVLSC